MTARSAGAFSGTSASSRSSVTRPTSTRHSAACSGGVRQRHADPQLRAVVAEHGSDRQERRVEVGEPLLLRAARGQQLAEVAAAVEEPDADDRHAEIARGLEVIAGEDPESAGVLRQHLGEPELGREVGDRTGRVRQRPVPARAVQARVEALGRLAQAVAEGVVGGELGKPRRRGRGEHRHGVARGGGEPGRDRPRRADRRSRRPRSRRGCRRGGRAARARRAARTC